MELGALIYILFVFGFGGLLLLVSIIYLLRELFRESRPTWRARSTSSKIVLIGAFVLAVLLASVPAQMLWLTRSDAIAGNYCADGSWGSATLVILEDGNFIETFSKTTTLESQRVAVKREVIGALSEEMG